MPACIGIECEGLEMSLLAAGGNGNNYVKYDGNENYGDNWWEWYETAVPIYINVNWE